MPVTLTKAALKKLLVDERKTARSKQKQSAFMRRSLSIYNAQKSRRFDIDAKDLPYTIVEFRTAMDEALVRGVFCYCNCKLTVNRITPDHKESLSSGGGWDLTNIGFCCQSCNWQKGRLTEKEFRRLLAFCKKYLSPDSAIDIKKRLSLGGKWSPR